MSYSTNDARADLDRIPSDIKLYDRIIEVAAIITKLMSGHVKESDMPIIVGGLSMKIYTESEYTTHDRIMNYEETDNEQYSVILI